MNFKKLFHILKDENVAVPEIHSEDFADRQDSTEQAENERMEKEDILYKNVAVPEVHFHHKKKSK